MADWEYCKAVRIGGDGEVRAMSPEQWAAYADVSAMQILLLDAKELVYWAFGMDRVFVSSLSGAYNSQADSW